MGFTLRHHPAVRRAHELLLEGAIGEAMYVRGCYGHGGRHGYEHEWRSDAKLAGGGELIDQGVHLIDLSRWFLGEFHQVAGMVGCYFWRGRGTAPERAVEDNAFLLLRTSDGKVASLHASWTQWKNLFSFEVYGEKGSLHVSGLGGHYGAEQLILARRRPEGGPPVVQEIDLSSESGLGQEVWSREWESFVLAVLASDGSGGSRNCASAFDAWQVLRIVEAAYQSSKIGKLVHLDQSCAVAAVSV